VGTERPAITSRVEGFTSGRICPYGGGCDFKYDPVIPLLLEARRCIVIFAAAEGARGKYMGPINTAEGYFAFG